MGIGAGPPGTGAMAMGAAGTAGGMTGGAGAAGVGLTGAAAIGGLAARAAPEPEVGSADAALPATGIGVLGALGSGPSSALQP
jgi:hypothetical protein